MEQPDNGILRLLIDNAGLIVTVVSAIAAVIGALATRAETRKQRELRTEQLRQTIDSASLDWGSRLGYDPDSLVGINRRAVGFVADLARDRTVPVVVNGVIGPRGDGYAVTSAMTAAEAASYHALQARALADAGVDLVTAVTMTYSNEAIGVVRAVAATGVPVAISFTTETDGRLPSGEDLGAAIESVDDATDGAAAYFNVNCAHPTHFAGALRAGESWTSRVKGVRVNASTSSHAELDEAEELDRGDIAALARHCADLRELHDLRLVGGCCGTDTEHLDAIAATIASS